MRNKTSARKAREARALKVLKIIGGAFAGAIVGVMAVSNPHLTPDDVLFVVLPGVSLCALLGAVFAGA